MEKRFSGCEIVEIGIQIEKNGYDFYAEIAKNTDDEKLKELYGFLACEEKSHIDAFKDIFKGLCDYSPEGAYPDEYFSYMNALASDHVFTKEGKGVELAKGVENVKDGLAIAVSFEKDTVIFFEEMKKLVPENEKQVIDRLIDEEKKHLKKLIQIRSEL